MSSHDSQFFSVCDAPQQFPVHPVCFAAPSDANIGKYPQPPNPPPRNLLPAPVPNTYPDIRPGSRPDTRSAPLSDTEKVQL